jgi:hypothetical protein
MPRFGGRPRRGIIGGSPRFGRPCRKRFSELCFDEAAFSTRGFSCRSVRKVLKNRRVVEFMDVTAVGLVGLTAPLSRLSTQPKSAPPSQNVCLAFLRVVYRLTKMKGHLRVLRAKSLLLHRAQKVQRHLKSLCALYGFVLPSSANLLLDPRGATVYLICPSAFQEPRLHEECKSPNQEPEDRSWTGTRARKVGEGEAAERTRGSYGS